MSLLIANNWKVTQRKSKTKVDVNLYKCCQPNIVDELFNTGLFDNVLRFLPPIDVAFAFNYYPPSTDLVRCLRHDKEIYDIIDATCIHTCINILQDIDTDINVYNTITAP